MDDIDMELWMARQSGLNEQYQARLMHQGDRVKTMEEDMNEREYSAQKSVKLDNFKPMRYEDYQHQISQRQQAAKFQVGRDDRSSSLEMSYAIRSALKWTGIAIAAIGFLIGPGLIFTLPIAAVVMALSGFLNAILKSTEIDKLFGRSDSMVIAKIMNDGNALKYQLQKYKTWGEVPADLQDSVITWAEDSHQSMKDLKNALVEAASKK